MKAENEQAGANPPGAGEPEGIRTMIRGVIDEYLEVQKHKAEPAHKAELVEERRKRETLERRVNELVTENQKTRQRAEEAERSAAIRGELQRLGVAKLDLAFRAVQDEIVRNEQGRLVVRGEGETDYRDYLGRFVQENPELLPARGTGGSGASLGQKGGGAPGVSIDLDRIKPGMDPEELDRARKEISRIASQTTLGH